jgi:hypothetical protein
VSGSRRQAAPLRLAVGTKTVVKTVSHLNVR